MDNGLKNENVSKKGIPPNAILFRWLKKSDVYPSEPDFILPSAFQPDSSDGGMSTDWQCDFCRTGQESLKFAPEEKRPSLGIAEIRDVGEIRKIIGLTVEHTPKLERLSHTDIYGVGAGNKTDLFYKRVKLHSITHVIIPLPVN